MKRHLTYIGKATAAFLIGYIGFATLCIAATSLWLVNSGYTRPGTRHGRALTTPPK